MNFKNTTDYTLYLPPYRSLLNPGARYDYRTHALVPIAPNEMNKGEKGFRKDMKAQRKSSIKMKYSSLLNDMSKSMTIRISNSNFTANKTIKEVNSIRIYNLPQEVMSMIFDFVDDKEDYKRCLLTCKYFYLAVKPHLYKNISFTSTYRFAQFVTYLRLNPEVGSYIQSIDLSGIKPCNYDLLIEDVDNIRTPTGADQNSEFTNKILAGWRDWKFKNSSLYSKPPSRNSMSYSDRSKVFRESNNSNNGSYSKSSKKFSKAFKYWGQKKKIQSQSYKRVPYTVENISSVSNSDELSHPKINKYLLNYSDSKDVPIGYIVHTINLCPNLIRINLGSVSLSTEYEVKRSFINKFQTFDVMNNFDKSLIEIIDGLTNDMEVNDVTGSSAQRSVENQSSSASSIYSIATFSKPIRKYTSLLPPLPQTVTDMSFLKKGDGKVFLSDLSLKSIDQNYLTQMGEVEILVAISKLQGKHINSDNSMTYLNLTSIIWLNKRLVQQLLVNLLDEKSTAYLSSCRTDYADSMSLDGDVLPDQFENVKQNLIVDLTNSGMHKDLPWAKLIDLNTYEGCELASRIIKDESLDEYDFFRTRDRIRRGRIAENYFA